MVCKPMSWALGRAPTRPSGSLFSGDTELSDWRPKFATSWLSWVHEDFSWHQTALPACSMPHARPGTAAAVGPRLPIRQGESLLTVPCLEVLRPPSKMFLRPLPNSR